MFLLRIKVALALFVLLAFSTQGCSFPIVSSPAHGVDVDYIDESAQEAIEVGSTSEIEIVNAIGTPDLKVPNPSRWYYKIARERPGVRKTCMLLGLGMACTEPQGDLQLVTYLELFFDDSGVLIDKRIYDLRASRCNEYGVCLSDDGLSLAVDASESDDLASKKINAVPLTCKVYVYRLSNSLPISAVWLKGSDIAFQVVRPDRYQIMELSEEAPELIAGFIPIFREDENRRLVAVGATAEESVSLDCGSRTTHFVEISDHDPLKAKLVTLEAGLRQIRERKLAWTSKVILSDR